jgi:5-methylcytosine-specific restriction endonuclease McrA
MFFKALKKKKQELINTINALDSKIWELETQITFKELDLKNIEIEKKHQIWLEEKIDLQIEKELRNLVVSFTVKQELAKHLKEQKTKVAKQVNEYYSPNHVIQVLQRPTRRKAIANSVRTLVFKRDNHTCLCCGRKDNLAIDHILAVNNGGTNDLENLQVLCKYCNSSKGTKTIDYRK